MTQVSGVKEIKAAFGRKLVAHEKGLRAGLLAAGSFLQRESQKIVPVDTGTLKNSANTRAEGTRANTVVTVSYGTEYSIYVHENMEAQHMPGKFAKFLETPLREKRDRMAAIVAKEAEKASQ